MPPTHPADPADPADADNGDHAGVDVNNADDAEAGVDVNDPALIPILAQPIAWLQHGSIPTVPDDHHIYTRYVYV